LPVLQGAVLVAGMTIQATRCFSPDGGTSFLLAGPADGVPVLLIHGLGWDAGRLWAGLVDALAAAGFRVIAPDLKGVGQSALLQGPVTIDDYAADLERLLDDLEIGDPVIVGFSMGVMVAVRLATRPDRTPLALILACGLVKAGPTEGTEAMLRRARDLGPETFAAEQAEAVFGPAYRLAAPAAVEDFITWRAAMDQPSLHHAFRASYGVDLTAKARAINCPTLVIAAADDPFVDLGEAERLSKIIPDARFTVIEGCGHMAPIERPEAFQTAVLGHLTAWRQA
jgi:3-oxoadipate enol-lactonase